MTRFKLLSVVGGSSLVVTVSAVLSPAVTTGQQSATVQQEARTALGGEQRFAGLRAIEMRGRRMLSSGRSAVVEIYWQSPDRCVRIDTVGGIRRRMGFNGSEPIIEFTNPSGMTRVPLTEPRAGLSAVRPEAALAEQRLEFARLLFGFFGAFPSWSPVTFNGVSSAVGREHLLRAVDSRGQILELFVDAVGGMPTKLKWQEAHRPVSQEPLAALRPGSRPDQRSSETATMAVVFEAHRHVEGFYWPHRIRRIRNDIVLEDIAIDSLAINRAIDARTFKPLLSAPKRDTHD